METVSERCLWSVPRILRDTLVGIPRPLPERNWDAPDRARSAKKAPLRLACTIWGCPTAQPYDVVYLLEPLEPQIISGHLKWLKSDSGRSTPKWPKSDSKVTKVIQKWLKSSSKVTFESLLGHFGVDLPESLLSHFRCLEIIWGSTGSSRG